MPNNLIVHGADMTAVTSILARLSRHCPTHQALPVFDQWLCITMRLCQLQLLQQNSVLSATTVRDTGAVHSNANLTNLQPLAYGQSKSRTAAEDMP